MKIKKIFKKITTTNWERKLYLSRRRLIGASFFAIMLVGVGMYLPGLLKGEAYQLSPLAQQLVGEPNELLATRLEYRSDVKSYDYNESYRPRAGVAGQDAQPRFRASFDAGENMRMSVEDPVNGVSLGFEPQFALDEPVVDQNRLIYPLQSMDGAKVVSLKSVGFKEDIVLNQYQGDELSFTYDMVLPEGTEARLEVDGSVAIYGVDPALLGEVMTAEEEDEALLDQARENSPKQTLLFTIPAPFVKETGKTKSEVETYFDLEGNELTIHTRGLEEADYPLSIDPSVYVESAVEMMRGNAETNIDFDIDSGLVRKGNLSGASFNEWNASLALNQNVWGAGTTAAGGHIYSVGGNDGNSHIASVYWANVNSPNQAVSSPNPGDGVCGGWCSDPAYDLPEVREGLSLVAYNGYLYAMGGTNSTGEHSDHVYIAKLGANGEPRLWHPTSTDQGDWVYWYRDEGMNLSSGRTHPAAVAYDGKLYILGGQTNIAPNGTSSVEFAEINPNGTFGAWSSTGMSSLPASAGRHYHSAEVYNDRIYIIGGVAGSVTTGNIVGNVYYTKLDNGTMSDWRRTSPLSSPRMSWGGDFTTIWNGHIYQSGGCSAVNPAGAEIAEGVYCTEFEGSTQFASINTDGSLAPWNTVANGDNPLLGHGLTAWNGALYRTGGCSAQDTTDGSCTAFESGVDYASLNEAGDISPLSVSSPSGSGLCTGSEPYDCDLPPAGNGAEQGGQLLASSAIVKGYLYTIGGCVDAACTDTTGNVSYARVATDGTLSRPETCIDGYYGAWCVDSTNRVNGNFGVAAAAIATFRSHIYLVGGTDGSSNTNAIYRNSVENDGSLSGSWTSQDLSGGNGVGASDVAHSFAHTKANPASAGTNPGNLFIFGGCDSTSNAECQTGSYLDAVYKCDIETTGAIANCATTNQLQIDAASGASGTGLALHGGAVFANYIYLTGGVAPGQTELDTVRYARFDDDNNVVAASGSSWIESSATIPGGGSAGAQSFAHNGYLYLMGGFDETGSAVRDDVAFARIDPSDGSLAPFATSNTSIDPRWGQSVVVSSSKAYILGGCSGGAGAGSCTALDASVRTVNIHNNEGGGAKEYSPSDNLFGTDRIAAGSAIHDGYIYIASGCTDSAACTQLTDDIQYAPLDGLGNIGGWSSATAALPQARAWGRLEAVGGTLYFIGGQNSLGDASADIYYSTPSAGDVSSWATASNVLPEARSQHSTAVWDDRIYVTGGNNGSDTTQNSVYVSPQLSSGGDINAAWSSSTGFDVNRRGHTAVAYANNLYIIGGNDGSNYLNDVQFAKINPDGTVGTWAVTSSTPLAIQQGDGFAANGYIYLFGGRAGDEEADCKNTTFVAPISANTAGGEATGLGSWFESSARFGGARFGISASYHEGRAYLLGGGCAQELNRSEVYTEPGEHTFTSPSDTTQVVIEAWGGGGGGGQGENGGGNAAGGGGGGGGYARHTMPVNPGDYTLNVGAGGAPNNDGEGSWFNNNTTVFADGGGGAGFGVDIGIGGSANIGSDATFSGGSGGSGWEIAQPFNRRGGGGGGSGFNNADGGDGQDGTQQAGSGTGGSGTGVGGSGGVDEANGEAGGEPGAGGGGGGYQALGGAGANGRVVVYYDEWTDLILTGNNRVSVATLLAQPQVADYSYMVDGDSDVFPYAWRIDGSDSFSPSVWSFEYRSSLSDTASWGDVTSFDSINLGEPQDYTPLDGTGTDTNFARYYYFKVAIDSTHTYGYPDTTAQSPTITDMSLFFTADPSKRLRHGGTFLDGQIRPYDTPF